MVRVKRAHPSATLGSFRFMTRHLFAVFILAVVGCCVSVYLFLLRAEVSQRPLHEESL